MADLDIRWRAVRRMVRTVVVDQDLLGRRGGQIGADSALRVSAFSDWLTSMMQTTVLDTGIIRSYVERASALGVRTASVIVGSGGTTRGRTELITGLAVNELRAIGSLVAQQSARAVAAGLLQGWTTARVVREVTTIIDKVAIARSRLVADHVVVRSYNDATLDVFEQAGHDMVDVLPELRPAVRVGDAKKKKSGKSRKTGPGSRVSRSRTPSASTIYRIARLEAETEAWAKRVNVETAEDDKVCSICLGIAEDGPYTINRARSLIPAHPRCRCAFVPVRRKARVKDAEWDENKITRVAKGYSEGGQFSESQYGRTLSKEEFRRMEPRWEVYGDRKERERRKQAVREWMTGGYEEINNELRGGEWQTGPEQRHIRSINDIFDRASHELQSNVRVWRGVSTRHGFADVKEGDEISDLGFNSTATDRSFAKEFVQNMPDRALVQITIPKGKRVFAPMVSGGEEIFGDNESEILLPRGTRYRITKRRGNVMFAEVVS